MIKTKTMDILSYLKYHIGKSYFCSTILDIVILYSFEKYW